MALIDRRHGMPKLRGEVAEPGLRRTPGERVDSEGSRGFKSPPLRQRVPPFGHSPEHSAKWPTFAAVPPENLIWDDARMSVW